MILFSLVSLLICLQVGCSASFQMLCLGGFYVIQTAATLKSINPGLTNSPSVWIEMWIEELMQPTYKALQPLHLGKESVFLQKTWFWGKNASILLAHWICVLRLLQSLHVDEVFQDTKHKLEALCTVSLPLSFQSCPHPHHLLRPPEQWRQK